MSQLKAIVGCKHVVVPALPDVDPALQVPVQVLDRRLIQRGGSMVAQVKVCWSGLDAALATWEDTEALKSTFPNSSAWGQATSKEEWGCQPHYPEGRTNGRSRGEHIAAKTRLPCQARQHSASWARMGLVITSCWGESIRHISVMLNKRGYRKTTRIQLHYYHISPSCILSPFSKPSYSPYQNLL